MQNPNSHCTKTQFLRGFYDLLLLFLQGFLRFWWVFVVSCEVVVAAWLRLSMNGRSRAFEDELVGAPGHDGGRQFVPGEPHDDSEFGWGDVWHEAVL